jgi:insulin-like growth factor-binding protein complex acid labile subunit
MSNGIQEIDPEMFVGLESLNSIVLINNQISTIHPGTFAPLSQLTYLDLERNQLTSITEETFSDLTNLFSLYLEVNQINEINPHFAQRLTNLRFININGNVCGSGSFFLTNELGWMELHKAAQNCFNNFEGIVASPVKRVILEYTGSLTISDGFGNIVGRL